MKPREGRLRRTWEKGRKRTNETNKHSYVIQAKTKKTWIQYMLSTKSDSPLSDIEIGN